MSVVRGPATAPSPMSPLGEKNCETENGASSGPVCERPAIGLFGPQPTRPTAKSDEASTSTPGGLENGRTEGRFGRCDMRPDNSGTTLGPVHLNVRVNRA